jgi:isopentenyl diphosphate isomerase/L-lactate dehydrogenase-like FMN-dependent dehydrogenase
MFSSEISTRTSLILVYSLKDNEAAFNRYKIRPRVLVNVAKIDLETEIFGVKVRINTLLERLI